MAIKLNASFLNGFVGEHELGAMEGAAQDALSKLQNKTGHLRQSLKKFQYRFYRKTQ